jgi:hypothetical protein
MEDKIGFNAGEQTLDIIRYGDTQLCFQPHHLAEIAAYFVRVDIEGTDKVDVRSLPGKPGNGTADGPASELDSTNLS